MKLTPNSLMDIHPLEGMDGSGNDFNFRRLTHEKDSVNIFRVAGIFGLPGLSEFVVLILENVSCIIRYCF